MRKRDEDNNHHHNNSSSESVSTNNTSNEGTTSTSSSDNGRAQRRRGSSSRPPQQRGGGGGAMNAGRGTKAKATHAVAAVAVADPPRNNARSRSSQPAPAAASTPTPAPTSSETRRELRKNLAAAFADPKCTLVPVLAPDVAFTRNQLRNAYLKLLFHHPFTQAAHGSEKALWVDTTYKVFDLYRARLSNAEHLLARINRGGEHQAGGTATPPVQGSPNTHTKRKAAFQECARIAAALRNFLSREDTFWKSLAERLALVFKITEAHAPLERANIIATGPKIPIGPRAEVGDDNQPSGLARLPSSPADLDPSLVQMAALPRHKQHLIETMYNVVIFCGDIARYREQFKDTHVDMASSSVRSNAAATSTPPRGPKRQHQHNKPPRDYTAAILCYDAARLILPTNGHASNQVAITASLQADNLSSVYHYYRSLCVKHPFQNAQQNLAHLLKKAADAFDDVDRIKRNPDAAERRAFTSAATLRRECVDVFVALQAWFFLHKKADDAMVLGAHFQRLLRGVIVDRVMPTDAIVRIVVTSIAASWWARLSRREAKESSAGEGTAAGHSRNTELNQLLSVLAIARVLIRIATEQQSGPHDDVTSVTRRVLPSLRILSKWLKSHLDYLLRNRDLCERQARGSASDDDDDAPAVFVKAVDDFWASFVNLVNTLRRAFPYESLPSLGNVGPTGAQALTLEEDTDLRGFIPTRRGMLAQDDGGLGSSAPTADTDTPSPPSEQLMRIADILIDAKVIAESEASPIAFDDESNTFGMAVDVERARRERRVEEEHKEEEASRGKAIGATRPRRPSESTASIVESDATEDVVDLAMRVVQERSQRILEGDESVTTVGDGFGDEEDDEDDDEDEDDDDEILIPAMASARKGHMDMQSVRQSLLRDVPQQQQQQQPQQQQQHRTAQDLFLQMLNGTPSLPGTGTATPSSPSASLHGLMPTPSPKRTSFGDIGSGRPSPSVGMGGGALGMNHHYQHAPSSRQLPHPLLGGNSIWGGGGWAGAGPASGERTFPDVWGGESASSNSNSNSNNHGSFFAGGLGSAFQAPPYVAPVWGSQGHYSPQQQQQQPFGHDPWGAPPR